MKVVLFCHSIVSDWNHGNAHFLRGIASEMIRRGSEVAIYEPANSWSLGNLMAEKGWLPVAAFHCMYPGLTTNRYTRLDLREVLKGADLILVHEWNEMDLIAAIGRERPSRSVLLFHDSHHRLLTDVRYRAALKLGGYDGVLAYGKALGDLYAQTCVAQRSWTWHEAADTRVFRAVPNEAPKRDLVWIGNWGDDERTGAIEEFLIKPVERLNLKADVYGVRYPNSALRRLEKAGIRYRGWLPNFLVPQVFSRYRTTMHIPRGPYVVQLEGIPTIRPFEALACRIPLLCAPWRDSERLFNEGKDYLRARTGEEMTHLLERVLRDWALAEEMARHGLDTIQKRHTCKHRVDELLRIVEEAKQN